MNIDAGKNRGLVNTVGMSESVGLRNIVVTSVVRADGITGARQVGEIATFLQDSSRRIPAILRFTVQSTAVRIADGEEITISRARRAEIRTIQT